MIQFNKTIQKHKIPVIFDKQNLILKNPSCAHSYFYLYKTEKNPRSPEIIVLRFKTSNKYWTIIWSLDETLMKVKFSKMFCVVYSLSKERNKAAIYISFYKLGYYCDQFIWALCNFLIVLTYLMYNVFWNSWEVLDLFLLSKIKIT